MNFRGLTLSMLLLGMVDQVNDGVALVEYQVGDAIMYSEVSLDLSACTPHEGQSVYFFKDYKIVTCVEEDEE